MPISTFSKLKTKENTLVNTLVRLERWRIFQMGLYPCYQGIYVLLLSRSIALYY